MPELPEVETVCRGLRPLVQNRTIKEVIITRPSIIEGKEEDFRQLMMGKMIKGITRHGKYIIFILNEGYLLSHLRMEGKYRVTKKDEPLEKHTHVRFLLDNGEELRYQDVRAFGKMCYLPNKEALIAALSHVGKEPWDKNEEEFYQELKKYRSAIKSVLLNQKVISGLGNIYVDEVLFKAQVHPETKANEITKEESANILKASQEILQTAIEAGGSTIHTYKNAEGKSGAYQEQLQVYGKKGEPCPRCQTPIEKIKVGGRGTHFCPNCQPIKS